MNKRRLSARIRPVEFGILLAMALLLSRASAHTQGALQRHRHPSLDRGADPSRCLSTTKSP
jgi:hypothetical protein